MKLKRLISILLLFCFSVYLGHSLIPHHHHAELAIQALKGDSPGDHEDHCDSEGHPLHCHAFNNIYFVKYDRSVIQQPVKSLSVLLVPVSFMVWDETDAGVLLRYAIVKQPDKTLKYFGTIPARAPPFSV